MKTSMKKITVYSFSKNRKAVMECIQKQGCVQLFDASEEGLERISVKEQMRNFEKYMASTKKALEILDGISPEKTDMFAEKKKISIRYYSLPGEKVEEINKIVFDIISKSKKIESNITEIGQLRASKEAYSCWTGLDIPMNFNSLKKAESTLYVIPGEITGEKIADILSDISGVHYEIIRSKAEMSCVWFVFLRSVGEDVHRTLRENGFTPPPVSLSHLSPKEKLRRTEEKIQNLEKENEDLRKELTKLGGQRNDIKLLYDYMKLRLEKYENLERLGQTEKTFVLKGYVPEKRGDVLKEKIEKTALSYVEVTEIPEDEEAPVLFSNNDFARPVEEITKTYSMPSKNDIDPNGIMAFFYYLFFGMMFSDAGYGLMVVIATAFLGFVKNYKKDTMMMFFWCGISTTFWGLMYGSFFGDVIYRFSLTFLGKEITLSPIWIDPVKEPLTLLIFSIGLGLLQILTGLGIAFHMNWKSGDKTGAICDIGSWIAIISGIIAVAAASFLNLPIMKNVGLVLAGAGVLTVVLMKGRNNKNVIMRIFSGILGLYDITSYVSDALSYSRLMALGLATGVIAQVVNIMGSLAGKSVLGFIMFAVVFAVGHLLNFAINMLGAYVHTNRLQYVEFFAKFYEGGGKSFEPLGMDTEYYEFTE